MYKSADFKRCYFNPLEEKPFVKYPRLCELVPDMSGEKVELLSRVMRYILALYDPKSPLIADYPDLGTRKTAAAEVAGFDRSADIETLEMLYTCDSELVVTIIVNFLREIVQSRAWASVQADEQTFWEFIQRMMLPINRTTKDKDDVSAVALKTKLSEDKESIGRRLDQNWLKFFSDDEDLKTKVEKKKSFSPEEIAGVK